MKNFPLCLIIAAFLITGHHAAAQSYEYKETHIVGKQPLAVFYDPATIVHIICGGIDADFDGVYEPDDGDALPSWWQFEGFKILTSGINPSPDGSTKKVRDLDFGNMGFPFRPGIRHGIDMHDSSGVLYISQNGRVKSYALRNGELLNDTVVNIAASAVYYAGDELFLSVRGADEDDKVLVYNLSEEKFTDTLTAGVNVQQVVKFAFFEQQYLAVLNEGLFGDTNSTVQIFDISDGNYLLHTTINLGNGGNHIAVNGGKMAVTVNGSKQVILIDVPDFTIDKVIPIPSESPYDGPRESIFTNDGIYTTSYMSKVFLIDPVSGEITGDLESDGKAEGILDVYGALIIANPLVAGGYAPDSTITVWFIPTDVKPANTIKQLSLYPNPVNDLISIGATFEESIGVIFQFQISDLSGRIVYERNFIPDSDELQIQFDISDVGIPPGSYYAIVKNSRYLRAVPFVKIK